MEKTNWIKVRKSMVHFYVKTALYYKNEKGQYILYKAAGEPLTLKRLVSETYPELYIQKENKAEAVLEIQKVFNQELRKNVEQGNIKVVKDNLVNLVEETLSEPRSGTLNAMGETVDILIDAYAKTKGIMSTLVYLSHSDYTTALHSVNVLALALGFAFFLKMDPKEVKEIGLAALFHDLGKTKVDPRLLNANRKLTQEEFQTIKSHPKYGYKILKDSGFSDSNILNASVEHHEKLDGSGYPYGKTNISEIGQIIGIVDCYEAITNDDRPYRDALTPIEALEIIKKEVDRGKFSQKFFKEFAYSLL